MPPLSMRRATGILVATLLLGGCTRMAESNVEGIVTPASPSKQYAVEVTAAQMPSETKQLDAEVTQFLRQSAAIRSVRYYKFSKDVPWIAISKDVQNQMSAKSVK